MSIPFLSIDYGGSKIKVAKLNDGKPVVIPFGDDSSIPNAIYVKDNTFCVGQEALKRGMKDPECLFTQLKKLMGRSIKDTAVTELAATVKYRIDSDEDGRCMVITKRDNADVKVYPSDLVAKQLQYLIEKALPSMGSPSEYGVMIAYPPSYAENQKKEIRNAVFLAGVPHVELVSESAATCISSGIKNDDNEHVAIVIDGGAATFDVSVVRIQNGSYDILLTDGLRDIGGNAFTDACYEKVLEEMRNRNIDIDSYSSSEKSELRNAIEEIKRRVSVEKNISLPIWKDPSKTPIPLSQNTINNYCHSLRKKCTDVVKNVLEKAANQEITITNCIITGGALKMKRLSDEILKLVHMKEVIQNSDDSVVLGAALCSFSCMKSHKKNDECKPLLANDQTLLNLRALSEMDEESGEQVIDEPCFPVLSESQDLDEVFPPYPEYEEPPPLPDTEEVPPPPEFEEPPPLPEPEPPLPDAEEVPPPPEPESPLPEPEPPLPEPEPPSPDAEVFPPLPEPFELPPPSPSADDSLHPSIPFTVGLDLPPPVVEEEESEPEPVQTVIRPDDNALNVQTYGNLCVRERGKNIYLKVSRKPNGNDLSILIRDSDGLPFTKESSIIAKEGKPIRFILYEGHVPKASKCDPIHEFELERNEGMVGNPRIRYTLNADRNCMITVHFVWEDTQEEVKIKKSLDYSRELANRHQQEQPQREQPQHEQPQRETRQAPPPVRPSMSLPPLPTPPLMPPMEQPRSEAAGVFPSLSGYVPLPSVPKTNPLMASERSSYSEERVAEMESRVCCKQRQLATALETTLRKLLHGFDLARIHMHSLASLRAHVIHELSLQHQQSVLIVELAVPVRLILHPVSVVHQHTVLVVAAAVTPALPVLELAVVHHHAVFEQTALSVRGVVRQSVVLVFALVHLLVVVVVDDYVAALELLDSSLHDSLLVDARARRVAARVVLHAFAIANGRSLLEATNISDISVLVALNQLLLSVLVRLDLLQTLLSVFPLTFKHGHARLVVLDTISTSLVVLVAALVNAVTVDELLALAIALSLHPRSLERDHSVLVQNALSLDEIILKVQLHRYHSIGIQENALAILLIVLPGALQRKLLAVLLKDFGPLSVLHHVLRRNVKALLDIAVKHRILEKRSSSCT